MVQVHPRLQTERLRLRPSLADDGLLLAQLAGAREVADTLISIPHPLSLAGARSMIAANAAGFQAGRSVHFAMENLVSRDLVGGVELRGIDRDHELAELDFWVAAAEWGQGHATEATSEVLRFGFAELGLNRIQASAMVRNPAAGAVLRRIGMKQEGVLRQRVRKWGVFEDVALYAALRSDFGPAGGDS
ncbi:MAG: GNAT family N-acetyltransferase [Myxococcota bacterium]